MTQGILMLALGAPQYGQLACNLAAAIRHSDKDTPIHLIWSGRALAAIGGDAHKALFTSFAECPPECYTHEGAIEYYKSKTHMYDLSPFDRTLFLDVDMVMLPTTHVGKVIDGLAAKCGYTMENRGWGPQPKRNPYTSWIDEADLAPYRDVAGVGQRLYRLQSELIYFEKNAFNDGFFDNVKEIYTNRPIPHTAADGVLPDEYAFNIASYISGHWPHQDNYTPIYWPYLDGVKTWHKDVTDGYLGFSLGGEQNPPAIVEKELLYRRLYTQSNELPYLHNVGSKKDWR